MGNYAEFPIHIQSKKQNLPVAATREEMWHTGQELNEWLPQASYPQVNCRFDLNTETGEFTPIVVADDGHNLTQYEDHAGDVRLGNAAADHEE